MKFSILIAHYNNWDYFQECYISIVNQTYKNYEIVIVDDCSNDGSYEKLLELSLLNNKIKLFKNEVNSKVGFTKYRCIEEASGDICGFLDPDDKLSNNALEKIIQVFKNNNIVATYSYIKLINSNSEDIGNFKFTRKIKNNSPLFFNINFEVAHFFSFRREEYFKTTKIDNTLVICEDQDLYMKLYELGKFKLIEDYLYFYRIHEKGISQNKTKSEKQRQDWHNVLYETCKRRNITKIKGISVDKIDNLPSFIYNIENTFYKRFIRKFKK